MLINPRACPNFLQKLKQKDPEQVPKTCLAILFFLFFTSQSFAIDRVVSSLENSDIDLSLESPDSTVSLNTNGVLNANIIMNNSSQSTIFNGGTLNGNINGTGKINVNSNSNLNGNVDISSIIKIDNNATLSIQGGDIKVSIRGSSDEVGAVNFTGNNTLFASVGTGSTTLQSVEISNNSTLNTLDKTIDALFVKINSGSILNYGGGDIVGSVKGSGDFIFSGSDTTKFDIIESINGLGEVEKLSQIKINNGATITLGKNITAETINIGEGENGTLKSNSNSISAANINIFQGAKLDIDINSNVIGDINGSVAGVGTLQFSGSNNNYVLSDSFGESKKLAEILISNETSLIINNNIAFNADVINIGEGSNPSNNPTLTQNNGSIGADSNSLIRLNENAIFNYNGGAIFGIVRASSSGKGTFNINHDYTSNSKIGQDGSLLNLNIAATKTLTANADIAADNILLSGTLNLGNSSKTITGNLSTSGGSAIIDLGSAHHTISGDFSTSNGDILKINAFNNSNIGSLASAGNITIANGLGLQISYDSDAGYLSDGSKISIISGTSGAINEVFDSNINVNNSSSNESGLLTFKTVKSDNELFLLVDRKGAETFTNNQFSAKLYNNIDQIGSNATGNLRDLQKFIDKTSTSNSQRDSALQSIVPQNNQDLNNSVLDSAKSSINITSARLESSLFRQDKKDFFNFLSDKNSRNFSNFSKKENIANLNKLSFDDEIFDNQAIWIQGFGSSATQENVGNSAGYEYSSQGLAIGVDQEVLKNLRLGISSSFSAGNVQSNSANKKQTDIESYQFNFYGGYNFKPYFITGIVGVAINKYDSTRPMPEMNLSAKAAYGGETYLAKFDGGMNKSLGYGFVAVPKISLTMARNQISTYTENGAGSLNLQVSNEKNNFLEGRIGTDLQYQGFEIGSARFEPKINASYGYDFLASDQSSTNKFQGQSSTFQIKNSNIDKDSLKYGFGLNIYEESGILMMMDYEVENKSNYTSQTGSVYFRYGF